MAPDYGITHTIFGYNAGSAGTGNSNGRRPRTDFAAAHTQEDGTGDALLPWLSDDAMSSLFERFVKEYFRFHHPELRGRALEIGERLGVLRDYPTPRGCTSPYVPEWIGEMVRRQEG